jgi:uncharacterized membrane protein
MMFTKNGYYTTIISEGYKGEKMTTIRGRFKLVNFFMVFLLLMMSVPCQPVFAAMISTEEIVDSKRAAEARNYVQEMLAREEIRTALLNQGIDPAAAQARINSLTDTEAVELADRLEKVPAGGIVGVILGVALVTFIVLIVTDILGYTDIFPFVKSKDATSEDAKAKDAKAEDQEESKE